MLCRQFHNPRSIDKMKKLSRRIFFVLILSLLTTYTIGSERLTATIIGSGSPIYNESRAGASVLISNGNTQILVDMGNGTQANLRKARINLRKMSALVFTHHHLDHNEEFLPILIRSLMGKNNFKIIGPPNTTNLTETNLRLFSEDIAYRLGKTQRTLADRKKAFTTRDIQGGESFNIEGIRVSTQKVPHTIHAIAYRFDYNKESIVITGDLTFTEDLPKLAKDADFLIIDSGGMVMTGGKRNRGQRRKGMRQARNQRDQKGRSDRQRRRKNRKGSRMNKGERTRAHLNLRESSLIAKLSNVKNLVYTHFTSGEVDKEASLKEIRKNYAGTVVFGKDLMIIRTGR